ncbi:trypsin-like peptidase domain-containing protein [Pseudomonadota bacterium]
MENNNKKLPICDELLDEHKKLLTHFYCAPIFIASTFSGTFWVKEEHLAPEKIDENTTRSGTVTFIKYKGELYALTCKHVIDALKNKQREWKEEQEQKFNFTPPEEGIGFYTPIDNNQYHFNYEFTIVPVDDNGVQPDLAIARVELYSIERLKRKPLIFTGKSKLPETGIASGYPEEQRIMKQGEKLNTFSPKIVTCTATLNESMAGNIYIEDSIDSHNDVDVLSGMSGGPLIWSSHDKFGLAGIVKSGYDIQPKEGGLILNNCIVVHGERITPKLLDNWLKSIPSLNLLEDKSKSLFIPE